MLIIDKEFTVLNINNELVLQVIIKALRSSISITDIINDIPYDDSLCNALGKNQQREVLLT